MESQSSNPFKRIEPSDSLPPEVKNQTLSNVFGLRLILDLADLFLVKSATSFLDSISPSSSENLDTERSHHDPTP